MHLRELNESQNGEFANIRATSREELLRYYRQVVNARAHELYLLWLRTTKQFPQWGALEPNLKDLQYDSITRMTSSERFYLNVSTQLPAPVAANLTARYKALRAAKVKLERAAKLPWHKLKKHT